MRAILQRVSSASVAVDSQTMGQIAPGLVVLAGVEEAGGPKDAAWLAAKIVIIDSRDRE